MKGGITSTKNTCAAQRRGLHLSRGGPRLPVALLSRQGLRLYIQSRLLRGRAASLRRAAEVHPRQLRGIPVGDSRQAEGRRGERERPRTRGRSRFTAQPAPAGGLAGVVAGDQFGDSRVYVADLHAAVQPGYSQVGIPLDFFPVGFQLVLVTKLVEQRVSESLSNIKFGNPLLLSEIWVGPCLWPPGRADFDNVPAAPRLLLRVLRGRHSTAIETKVSLPNPAPADKCIQAQRPASPAKH